MFDIIKHEFIFKTSKYFKFGGVVFEKAVIIGVTVLLNWLMGQQPDFFQSVSRGIRQGHKTLLSYENETFSRYRFIL